MEVRAKKLLALSLAHSASFINGGQLALCVADRYASPRSLSRRLLGGSS